MTDQDQPVAERHGSRWYDARPSAEEVTAWFQTQKLHEGLYHDDYVGGIVLISAEEKQPVTVRKADGGTFVREDKRSVHVPYVKVDTRVAYFWDLVRAMNEAVKEDRFVGVIEPVAQKVIDADNNPYFNAHLPAGFTVYPVVYAADGKMNKYLVATWRAAIYKREDLVGQTQARRAVPVVEGVGSKQVAMWRQFPDDNAIMKAQTGAIGRALGVGGILVVGTGIASAEDMQEQQASSGPAVAISGAEAAKLPSETVPPPADAPSLGGAPAEPVDEDAVLRATAEELAKAYEDEDPEGHAVYVAWYKEREFGPFTTLTGPALKGAVTKLERDLDTSRQRRASAAQAEAGETTTSAADAPAAAG